MSGSHRERAVGRDECLKDELVFLGAPFAPTVWPWQPIIGPAKASCL